MKVLSIITVVRNDYEALLITEKSIIEQRQLGAKIEWIIIDACSKDKTIEYFSKESNLNVDTFISEPDKGIYDAMNKGIRCAKGFGLIFLNAGDYFVGKLLANISPNDVPCFLKVKYKNYFGKYKTRRISSKYLGIPNGHQGIIFENSKKIFYDIRYKICADYKYFLDYGYTEKLDYLKADGYVFWDQGVSLQNWKDRDKEIFDIRRKYFGLGIAIIYESRPLIKRILRTLIFRDL